MLPALTTIFAGTVGAAARACGNIDVAVRRDKRIAKSLDFFIYGAIVKFLSVATEFEFPGVALNEVLPFSPEPGSTAPIFHA